MRLKGRSTGGVAQTPPVPQTLCTKAFPKKTGGGEVFFRNNHKKAGNFCRLHTYFAFFQQLSVKTKVLFGDLNFLTRFLTTIIRVYYTHKI